jgi:hypothetical protein
MKLDKLKSSNRHCNELHCILFQLPKFYAYGASQALISLLTQMRSLMPPPPGLLHLRKHRKIQLRVVCSGVGSLLGFAPNIAPLWTNDLLLLPAPRRFFQIWELSRFLSRAFTASFYYMLLTRFSAIGVFCLHNRAPSDTANSR